MKWNDLIDRPESAQLQTIETEHDRYLAQVYVCRLFNVPGIQCVLNDREIEQFADKLNIELDTRLDEDGDPLPTTEGQLAKAMRRREAELLPTLSGEADFSFTSLVEALKARLQLDSAECSATIRMTG